MAWLLFLDESGQDRRESPYEVLAGIAVEDCRLWQLIRQLSDLQVQCFGYRRFAAYGEEAKAKRLLKSKTFKLAARFDPIALPRRTELARAALTDGLAATPEQLAALGQSKIDYVIRALRLCKSHHCVSFASIVPREAERPVDSSFLRKDYSYLFERYHHFLEHKAKDGSMGLVVFDELEKTQSHVLIGQMDSYFQKTVKGRSRSKRIIPEPLFVHSDLTTMIQMADLLAYTISWGVRLPRMAHARRIELDEIGAIACELRYFWPADNEKAHDTWGFSYIPALLPSKA